MRTLLLKYCASYFHLAYIRYSFVAHTAFALAICGASTWNASSYYFSHFARTYEASVDQRVMRASAMSERASSDN